MQTETVRLHRSRRISWLIFKARTTSIFKSMENLRPESFDVGAVKSEIFPQLGLEESNPGVFAGQWFGSGPWIEKRSPIDGSFLGRVVSADRQDYERAAGAAHSAAKAWSGVPAPRRGEVVRRLAERLRQLKQPLGLLVTLEVGKIFAEGEGEVQEMIDICDFANGLSRQLYGLTIASERPNHRILENWHPLGLIGIISAFNFPVAVWSWNSALAIVCGNATLWKPSEKTPLTAVACVKIAAQVCHEAGVDPAIFSLVSGDSTVGTMLAEDRRALLVSATGSTRMGKQVANAVAKRLGRTLLELGGNNAVIVTPSANLALAVRALLFGAVGTTGQRCTTTRRLIAHQSLKDRLVEKLQAAYSRIRIGNPLRPEILMGPLIDAAAVEAMHDSLRKLEKSDGRILYGGESLQGPDYPSNNYVTPCIAEASNSWPVVQQETFAPILYVLSYHEFDEAIEIHNQVPQGLSSAIFSANISETEKFTSYQGSDCGLANVNVGTSGAEIGGAFGGEKETGGGRESGSDAWKAYMRRQTVTINYGSDLPLAQGIRFE